MPDKVKGIIKYAIATLVSTLILTLQMYTAFVIHTFEKGIDKNVERCEACEEENQKQDKELANLDKKIESHKSWHKGQDAQ